VGKSLEWKGVGGGEESCDYSAVRSVDNFHMLECHRISQKNVQNLRVDEKFVSVQKRSDYQEELQNVEAIELRIL